MFGVTTVIGPLLGGFLTDNLSWRWVFYVNLPLGVLALFVTSAVLPTGLRRGHPRIDVAGAVLLAGAVSSVVLVTTWGGTQYAWGSATIVALIAAALVLLAVLIVVERRSAEPIIPVHLFSLRTFGISSGASFIIGIAMFGAISFLPLFLQVVNGASATNSGLLLVPLMLGLLVASIGSGQLITRTGHYKLFPVVGTAIAMVAMVLLSTMGTGTTQGVVTAYMVILGAGIGLSMQPLVLATQNEVPFRDLGAATSSVSFFRSMGGSIGVGLFGALFNAALARQLDGTRIEVGEASTFTPDSLRDLPVDERQEVISAFADSLTGVFRYAAPIVAVAFVLTLLLREAPLRSAADHARMRDAGVLEAEDVAAVHL